MRFMQSAVLAAIGLFAFAPAEVEAQATTTTTHNVLSVDGFVRGSLCTGLITFSGTFHLLSSTTIDANGGIHLRTFIVAAGFQGVTATGDRYVSPGVLREVQNVSLPAGFPAVASFSNSFSFIGQGRAPNFHFIQDFHVTVNANGVVTAAFGDTRVECQEGS